MDMQELVALVRQLSERVEALEEEMGIMAEQIDALQDSMEEMAEDFFGDDEEDVYDIECPECQETIAVDAGILDEGFVNCPGCDATIEFQFGCDCEECEGNCNG